MGILLVATVASAIISSRSYRSTHTDHGGGVSLAFSGRPMPASPAHLADSLLAIPLPPGWRQHGKVYAARLPPRGTDLEALVKCEAPNVHLFGTTELTAFFFGPQDGVTYSTFEEQIGRTELPSVATARREDSIVGATELACIKAEAALGTRISYLAWPNDTVQPWVRVLHTPGVVSASQSTFLGQTNTSIDVIKNGYFARLIVTTPARSPQTDEILRAAISRM